MRNQEITGIGCFAAPRKLSRIFKKIVNDYALGSFDDVELMQGHGTETTILLNALIAGETVWSPWPRPASADVCSPKKIVGFFLMLSNQRLNLSIFARGNRSRREIFTTSLDELTRLRQKRLN